MLNGRMLGDSIGYYTCHKYNGSSVVDYMIISEELLNSVNYFNVQNLIGTISDHCKFSLLLKARPHRTYTETNMVIPAPPRYKWGTDSPAKFQESLITNEIQHILAHTMSANYGTNDVGIETFVENVKKLFLTAADISLRKINVNQQKNRNTKN